MTSDKITTKRPIKINGYCSDTLHAKRDRKRAEAQSRDRHYKSLTIDEKLSNVSLRRGNSQRERLALLAQQKPTLTK